MLARLPGAQAAGPPGEGSCHLLPLAAHILVKPTPPLTQRCRAFHADTCVPFNGGQSNTGMLAGYDSLQAFCKDMLHKDDRSVAGRNAAPAELRLRALQPTQLCRVQQH